MPYHGVQCTVAYAYMNGDARNPLLSLAPPPTRAMLAGVHAVPGPGAALLSCVCIQHVLGPRAV